MKNNNDIPTIHIDKFDGPLDLLLHLIRTSEIDIYNIPIASITDQYLQYIHTQNELQLNVAGEYLVMAAKLTEIKGKMLLPVYSETDYEEDVDPRDELVDQLLEYQQVQVATDQLAVLEKKRHQLFTRSAALPPVEFNLNQTAPGIEFTDLQAAFKKVLARRQTSVVLNQTISEEIHSLEEQSKYVLKKLSKQKTVFFDDLFPVTFSNQLVVINFLAILELVKKQKIIVIQKQNFSNIILELSDTND